MHHICPIYGKAAWHGPGRLAAWQDIFVILGDLCAIRKDLCGIPGVFVYLIDPFVVTMGYRWFPNSHCRNFFKKFFLKKINLKYVKNRLSILINTLKMTYLNVN